MYHFTPLWWLPIGWQPIRKRLQFEHLQVLLWKGPLLSRASVTLRQTSWFRRWALKSQPRPHPLAAPDGPWLLPRQRAPLRQVPRSQGNTWGLNHLPHSANITHRKVQDPGDQSAFYFTVHSHKFLHVQGNQITFRLALLVTKWYNYPGFKNRMGWYTLTIISL